MGGIFAKGNGKGREMEGKEREGKEWGGMRENGKRRIGEERCAVRIVNYFRFWGSNRPTKKKWRMPGTEWHMVKIFSGISASFSFRCKTAMCTNTR